MEKDIKFFQMFRSKQQEAAWRPTGRTAEELLLPTLLELWDSKNKRLKSKIENDQMPIIEVQSCVFSFFFVYRRLPEGLCCCLMNRFFCMFVQDLLRKVEAGRAQLRTMLERRQIAMEELGGRQEQILAEIKQLTQVQENLVRKEMEKGG